MQDPVIGLASKMFRLVEKMKRLIAEKRNMRMLRENIVQRSRPGFLHSAYDEVNVVDFSPLKERSHAKISIPYIQRCDNLKLASCARERLGIVWLA